jgi:S1-C subfamily serine protease
MITNRVIVRTYWIKCGSHSGTGFLADLNSKRYFITAKHVVNDFSVENPVLYSKNYGWHKLPLEPIWDSEDFDLAIFAPKIPTRPNKAGWDIELNPAGIQIGQDVFFIGYPYSMFTDTLGLNDGFPIGLVKKACFSGADQNNNIYFLDGLVNPGFSGCPVIAKARGSDQEKVIGIVLGFHGKKTSVIANGNETEMEVEYNSGIIRAVNIKIIVDQINTNPNGYPLGW